MSYVEKIMSDVIQTTSDLFSAVANLWETICYNKLFLCGYLFVTLCVTSFAVFAFFSEVQRNLGHPACNFVSIMQIWQKHHEEKEMLEQQTKTSFLYGQG